MAKYYAPEEIYYADAGVVTLGNDALRNLLAKIMVRVPIPVVDNTFENCVYLMPEPKRKEACFIPNRIIKDRHIILLPYALLSWPEEKQIHVILHETAHYALNHKSVLEDQNLDYERQELEANAVVDRWLRDYEAFKKQDVLS